MSIFDTSFENKTLSEELQDYKVQSIFETKRLQDYVCLKGRDTRLQERKDYKSLSKGERAIFFLGLELKFEPRNWTFNLDLYFEPLTWTCLLSSESILL